MFARIISSMKSNSIFFPNQGLDWWLCCRGCSGPDRRNSTAYWHVPASKYGPFKILQVDRGPPPLRGIYQVCPLNPASGHHQTLSFPPYCSCSALQSNATAAQGLQLNHAYTVIKVVVVKTQADDFFKRGERHSLIRLRNPQGHGQHGQGAKEWKGDWGDKWVHQQIHSVGSRA